MLINTFEIILLSVALILSLWISCVIAGSTLEAERLKHKSVFGIIFIAVQILMIGAGMWIGNRISTPDVKPNLLMAIGLLLVFGLKIIFTSVKNNPKDKIFDYSDAGVIFLSAIGEGINTLGIGLAVGLLSSSLFFHWLLSSSVLASGLVLAILVGSALGNDALKLRLGPIGGLILLAAAIKFAITLAGH